MPVPSEFIVCAREDFFEEPDGEPTSGKLAGSEQMMAELMQKRDYRWMVEIHVDDGISHIIAISFGSRDLCIRLMTELYLVQPIDETDKLSDLYGVRLVLPAFPISLFPVPKRWKKQLDLPRSLLQDLLLCRVSCR